MKPIQKKLFKKIYPQQNMRIANQIGLLTNKNMRQ